MIHSRFIGETFSCTRRHNFYVNQFVANWGNLSNGKHISCNELPYEPGANTYHLVCEVNFNIQNQLNNEFL